MTAKSVLGVKAYDSLLAVPDEIDLAVLIVPAVAVPATLAECGQKQVKAIIVISAGFKEMGPNGAALEKAVRDRARSLGIPLVGPNCLGMITSSPAVRLNATFGRVMPRFGNIALVSQSGAIGINALEYAESQDVGLSKFISIGNKADLSENDVLAYLKDDDETDVIMMYVEDLVNPHEFMRIARDIASNPRRPKPILAIKAGRTTEGAKAASSHTGALAGSDEAYNAFFSQARILRVETIEELFAKGEALAYQPAPKGIRVGILTNAGGVGIMATDACVRGGLQMAQLSDQTRAEMKKHLPATASTGNPVDVIGDADKKRYQTALELLVKDENVDGIIPIWTPTLMAEATEIAQVIAEVGVTSEKPILACIQTMGSQAEIRRALAKDKIPSYQFPENAARAMAAMAEYARWSRRPPGDVKVYSDVKPQIARVVIDKAMARQPAFLSEPEGHTILEAYGLPVLPFRLVKTADEAVAAAKEIGYPAVIKIVSPQVLHKTEFGGVRLGIENDAAMRAEFGSLIDVVKSKAPDADIWGVLVQKMAPKKKGTEVILGMKRDKHFGPLLMFGLGGVMVEVLKDVTFRLAPITDQSAELMITGIKAYKLLQPFRGQPARDVATIQDCLQRLSQLVTDFTEIDELDINPMLVYEQDQGALVLDARFLLK
jgi:acetyltransferase